MKDKIDKRYITKYAAKWGGPAFDGDGYLLYEYIRGSTIYGTNDETSDIDRGGVFICSNDILLGVTDKTSMRGYQSKIMSEKQDDKWYELSRYAELLLEFNPDIIESLFIDDRFVVYEHPIITELKSKRDDLVTKKCFPTFGHYALSQIHKAKGYNKKIVKPVNEKKSPIDFVYTFYKQGSTKISNWLEYRGMKQEFCGLVAIPNMHNVYGLYYDWHAHIESIDHLREALCNMLECWKDEYAASFEDFDEKAFNFREYYSRIYNEELNIASLQKVLNAKPAKYTGIVRPNSLELCLSSVPEKDAKPITHIIYNQEAYSKHAHDYSAYKKWEKERNQARYSLNKGHEFDAKNMSHAFRLLTMCIEIARGEGIQIYRKDAQWLKDIKHHKYSWEDLISKVEQLKDEMDKCCKESAIPESIDEDALVKWIVEKRKEFFKDM